MSLQILIEATTAAVTSPSFSAINNNNIGLIAADLGSGEVITVQIYAAAASTPKWINYTIASVQQELSASSPVIQIQYDTLSYRLVKPVTASAVGVSISSDVLIGGI